MFGSIVSAVGGIVGGVMGAKGASDASKAAAKASDAELQFNQQRYDDWKAVFGPVQDNLSAYYSNLTPAYYEAVGLEAFELENNRALEGINTMLAQRGITDSGIAAQFKQEAALEAASARANIRRQAPVQAAGDQQAFLALGMGSNPADSVANTLGRNAASARNSANAAASSQADTFSNLTKSVGSLAEIGLTAYMGG